jgi:excisionase family DNA binding protein
MEPFMTSEEIAELLHVDPATIRRLVTKGELSAYRIGSEYRFARSDLDDYLQRQRIVARADGGSRPRSSHPFDYVAHVLQTLLRGKSTTPAQLLGRCDLFTDGARQVLTLAQEEAQQLQHPYIGTEHLLLGLLRHHEGVACQVLRHLGIDRDSVRSAVVAAVGHGERTVSGELGLTPRAKTVVELALEEARGFGDHVIAAEHLLLGLLREGDGIAVGVLEHCGLDLVQVRTETLRVMLTQRPAHPEHHDATRESVRDASDEADHSTEHPVDE